MAGVATDYMHIVLDDQGAPRIAGTQLRVIDLVEAKLANAWTPEEVHAQHPDLTLGQIYAALSFYADHQPELDAAIADRHADVVAWTQQTVPSQVLKRLRHDGQI